MLTGRVVSGNGDLARWMRRYADVYLHVTGTDLHPGSLNVVLEQPWRLPTERIRLGADEVGVGVNLVPCRFLGTDAFIFRTDRAEAAGPAEQKVVEILSPLHLRAAFGLEDGQEVQIDLPEDKPQGRNR